MTGHTMLNLRAAAIRLREREDDVAAARIARNEWIVQAVREGVTVREVADATGITRQAVEKITASTHDSDNLGMVRA